MLLRPTESFGVLFESLKRGSPKERRRVKEGGGVGRLMDSTLAATAHFKNH